MSLAVNCAYQTECSMKSIRNGYGLLCFLFIIRSPSLNWYHFEHRTFIYQRTSGISYHINDIEVGRLACLQLVGHYVACFGWLCGLGPSAQTRYQLPGLMLLVVAYKLQYLLLWLHFLYEWWPGDKFWYVHDLEYALQIILWIYSHGCWYVPGTYYVDTSKYNFFYRKKTKLSRIRYTYQRPGTILTT